MKETVQICNNGHLLDWMENGTLETVLTEIFTNEHKNFSQSFRFGSKFALDFPSRTEWRITAPNERCHGRFTLLVRQCRIKRYILLHNIYHSLVCADEIAGRARNDVPGHPGPDPGSGSSVCAKGEVLKIIQARFDLLKAFFVLRKIVWAFFDLLALYRVGAEDTFPRFLIQHPFDAYCARCQTRKRRNIF